MTTELKTTFIKRSFLILVIFSILLSMAGLFFSYHIHKSLREEMRFSCEGVKTESLSKINSVREEFCEILTVETKAINALADEVIYLQEKIKSIESGLNKEGIEVKDVIEDNLVINEELSDEEIINEEKDEKPLWKKILFVWDWFDK